MAAFTQLVLLCRPGFEKDCAGEILDYANAYGFSAYIQTSDNSGYVLLIGTSGQDAAEFILHTDFRQLVFCRQWFASPATLEHLPEKNRLTPLSKLIGEYALLFYDVELDYPDTNEGKSLNRFCNQFRPHLIASLKKNRLLSAHADQRLHLLFLDSLRVYTGIAPVDNSSPYPMGIPRLRMPAAAPSRSTLKLDEAIHWFVNDETKYFKPGMHAVDLGAAPGGWSWQLAQRGLLVTAIDNGPMDEKLMQQGMVEHIAADAFTWLPDKSVDWLVCDMAERPLHVARLAARWLKRKHCKHAIFNLKLPMKKRWPVVKECHQIIEKELIQANMQFSLGMKQLYHDREEITVCVITL